MLAALNSGVAHEGVFVQRVAAERVERQQPRSHIDCLQHLQATGDAAVLKLAERTQQGELPKNLLENAIQHAPANTTVGVEFQDDAVIVRDGGPGVDAGLRFALSNGDGQLA